MFSRNRQPKTSEIQSLWIVKHQENNFLLEKTVAQIVDQFPTNLLLEEIVNAII